MVMLNIHKNYKTYKRQTLVILVLIIVFLILVTLRSASNQDQVQARTANTTSLDSVMLSNQVELTRQSGQHSCVRTEWYRMRSCETYELRIYKVSTDDKQFMSDMQSSLIVHGWASDTDLNTGNSFFNVKQNKELTYVRTSVNRLDYAYDGNRPLQTHIAMVLTNNPSPQIEGYEAIDYNAELKSKFTNSIASGNRLLLLYSTTDYDSL